MEKKILEKGVLSVWISGNNVLDVSAVMKTFSSQGSHSTWKPGKIRVHLENLEISWNFEKINKYHGKMTWNLEILGGY